MIIMVESSRSFLFTEYARTGCGTFKAQGPDPKVWDALPVGIQVRTMVEAELMIYVGQILRIPKHQGDSQSSQG